MKKYLLLIQLFYFSSQFSPTFGQTYNISNTTVNDNTGTLYDSGGAGNNYSNGENYNFTICPTNFESCILIDFQVFDLSGGDFLQIFDGTSLVASLTNGASPTSFVVYNSCVNIRFISNNFNTDQGWELTWTTSNDCPPPAPNDCIRAIPVCDNGILNFNSFGPGNNDFASPNNDKGCLLQGEHQSAWYKIQIGDHPTDGGLLEFVLTPEEEQGEDYDFAIYGPDLDCDNLGSPVRCSFADDNCHFCPETGLGYGTTDTSEGAACPECDGFVAALPVEPGEVYYILIDNFNLSFDGFELSWGADVILDCSILEDCFLLANASALGETTICSDGPDVQLQGLFELNQGIPTYYWQADPPEAVNFLNDSTIPNPIVIADSIPQDFNASVVYTLTVVDGDCSARDNVTVNIFSIPEPPSTDTLLNYCVGDVIEDLKLETILPGDIGWYDEDPALNPLATPLGTTPFFDTGIDGQTAGNYNYWVTETNIMCQSEATVVQLNIYPVPDLLGIPDQAICADFYNLADITLVDFNGLDLTQAKRRYFNTPDLAPISEIDSLVTESGIYWIQIDYFGCIAVEAVIVKLGDLTIEVQANDADCGQENGTATVFTSNGIPPYEYYWSTDPIQTDAIATDLAPGIYHVTVGDGTGCVLVEQFAVFAPPLPEALVASDGVLACVGDSIQLFGDALTTGTAIEYLWTGPDGFSTTEQNPYALITQSEVGNTYELVVTVDGCTSPAKSLELFGLPTPMPSIGNDGPSCENAPIALSTELSASGNGSSIEYYWSDSNGLVGTEQDLIIENPSDSTTYYLVLLAGNCWSDTVTTLVRVQEIPPIEVSNTSPVCIGEPIQLQANIEAENAEIDYLWTGPNNFSSTEQSPILTDAIGGENYTFSAIINGCPSNLMTTTVQYHSQPILPETLPTLYACEPPFDLANVEVVDENGNDLTLSYFNDNEGTIGAILQNTIIDTSSTFWIVGETSNGCLDSTRISTERYPEPNASFSISKLQVCADQEDFVIVTFNGSIVNANEALFNWDFDGGIATPGTGNGPHQVRWNNTEGTKTIRLQIIENGCPSEERIQSIITSLPLSPPIVNCIESSTNSVSFDWNNVPNANNYEISYTINNGATITENRFASNIIIDDLNPDDVVIIEVRALGDEPCGNSDWATAECQAQNCPAVELAINGLDSNYCQDDNAITLVGQPSGGIFSGQGINDNQFNPAQAGLGNNLNITYTYTDSETGCDYSTNQTVNVYAVPTALFEVSEEEICAEGGSVTLTYAGNATTAADFNWNFGGGNATPGNGIGPHIVDWSGSDGTFFISLNVSENGCDAEPFEASITAFPPIETPVITCKGTSTNSVGFEWNVVLGVTQYQVTYYINGNLQTSSNTDQTEWEISGLLPNDEVQIEVIALNDGPCGNSDMGSAVCIAQDCPDVELSFVDLQTEFCEGEDAFILAAAPIGGTFYLEGIEVTSIEANALNVGQYLLEYVLETGDCNYSIGTNIDILPRPQAEFSLSPDPFCWEAGAVTTALYEGIITQFTTLEWDFGNGSSPYPNNSTLHEITWNEAGTQTVTLVVEENGCRSAPLEQSIEVIEPLASPQVICASVSLSSVRFEWAAIGGAEGYAIIIYINGSQTNVQTTPNAFFSVENLNTLDEVRIEVAAIGGIPCGNSESSTQTCIAQDCPEIIPSIVDLESSFCREDAAVELTATPSGGTFSGDGVEGNTFSPSNLAAGGYTIFYQYTNEDGCVYDTQQNVEIHVPELFELQMPSVACRGEAVVLTLEGNTSNIAELNWMYNQNAGNLEDLGEGTFNLTWQQLGNQTVTANIRDTNGCSTNVSAVIEVYELEVNTIADTTIEEGTSIELTSDVLSNFSTDFAYTWWVASEVVDCDNCPFIEVSPEQLTVYTLEVADENGCVATTSVRIDVEEEVIIIEPPVSPIVLIPNAFSPNGDGVNDVFQVQAHGVASMVLNIFNRWGEKVFTSGEVTVGWDGTFKEEVQPIGTYVYTVEVMYEDGSREVLQGNLTLIR